MNKATIAFLTIGLSLALVAAVDICQDQFDGALLAHPADCGKFLVCRYGETDRIMTCPLGLHFNRFESICDMKERAACEESYIKRIARDVAESATCCDACDCDVTPATPATPVDPSTPDTPKPSSSPTDAQAGPSGTTCVSSGKCTGKPDGALLADANSTGYIVCQCECEITMPCAPGTAFNETLRTCDHIPCTGSGCPPQSTGPSGTTCSNSGTCAGKPDGTLITDPNSNGYIVCQCECEIEMPCAPGTAFNETLATCDLIPCTGSGCGGGGPSTGPSGTTCSNSGKCAGKPDGTMIADPNSNGYIVCQCECEIEMPCAPGTAFNETLATCDLIPCTGSGCGGGGPSTGPSGTTCSNSGTCAGKPDGTLTTDPNSNGYIVCQCECEIEMPCAPGTAFNETLATCDHIPCTGSGCGGGGPSTGPSGTTCSNSGKCAGKPDGTMIADPNSNGYILCQCECEIEMPCAPGTVFNETWATCDHIPCTGSGCGGGGPSTGPSGTTCSNSGKCAGKPDGTMIADPNSNGYILCQCECEIEMPCAPGTVFNETWATCDHIPCTGGGCGGGPTCSNSGQCAGKTDGTLIADPNSTGYIKCEGECEIQMTCDPGTSFNETLQICDQTGCGKTCSNSGQCAGKPDGTLVADPNSTGYIKCECECEIEMTCDPGTSFNETLQICDQTGCGKTCSNSGQCAGKPDGTLVADPNSTGYIKCECECEIEMTCDPGTSFNETLQICDQTGCGKTCSNSGQCAGKPDGTLIADPNSTGYIKCECECEIEMTCDPGTTFNETLQICDQTGCGKTCSNSGQCAGKPDGTLIADPNSTGYIKCECECEIEMTCDPGTTFNETLQICDQTGCGKTCSNSGQCAGKPDGTLIADPNSTGYIKCECECEIEMTCDPGTSFDEALQICDQTGCSKTCSNSGQCAGKPDGTLIADPNSTGYIKCECECEIEMTCDPGTSFDEALQICDQTGCGKTCTNSGQCAGKPDGTLIADPNTTGYIKCECECEIEMTCDPGTSFNETLQICDQTGCGKTCSNSGQCAGKPDGTLIADPNSTGYIKCECECEIEMTCDPGTSFDEALQICDQTGCSKTCSNSGQCAGEPDGTLIADPNSTGYIKCECECEIEMTCDPGTSFNEALQICDQTGCGKTCSNSGQCAGEPDGTLIADPNSTGYIKCECECEIEMTCDPGTSFNEALQICDQTGCGKTCSNSGQCAGKPDGTLIADPNSTGYIKCECECEIEMTCDPGTSFDEALQICDQTGCGKTCSNSGQCAGKPDGTLIADPNTTGYIKCECECEIEMTCDPGTSFNETLQICDQTGCGKTCSNSGQCAGKPDGTLIADPNSTGYIKCECECEIEMTCDPGTSFDEALQICDQTGCGKTCSNSGQCAGKPDGTLIADPNTTGYIKCECECEIEMTCDPGTSFNETMQICDQTGCGKTCSNSGQCAGKPDGTLIADPNSTGYIKCDCECEIEMTCDPGTSFDEALQICDQTGCGKTCTNSGQCAGKPDGTLIADPNTTGYIKCECECEIEMTCDPGTSFNETLQICDQTGCGKTCSNSGQCAGKPDGTLIADPNSTGYIKCDCECEIEMTCDPGTSFDEALQICDQTGCGKTCTNSGQCAGKPDGTLIADPNTTGYIKCECECEIEMTCGPGTSFNESLQICDQTGCGKTCSNSGQCAGKPDGTLIADPNTTGYIKCECECEIEMTCDPGTSYNETLQICDEAGCGKTCSNSGQCAGKPDGTLIADPNSTGYIKCECECEIEMTCDPGTSFNEALQICDQTGCSKTCSNSGQCAGKPDGTLIADPNTTGYIKCECECEIEMTCDPGTSYNETLQICDEAGCGKTCSNSGQCAGKPDGTLIADPNSTGYIKCECECEIEMTCDPGTSYNETLQICDEAGCGKTCSNSGQCAGKPDGTLIADPNSTGYIKCECECEIEMTCDPGTSFNESLQICDQTGCSKTCSNSGQCAGKPDGTLIADPNTTGYIKCECECEIEMTCDPGTSYNETLQICDEAGCGKTCSNSGQCAGKPDGTLIADPNSTGYIKCECECEIEMTCDPGTSYNETLQICDQTGCGKTCSNSGQCAGKPDGTLIADSNSTGYIKCECECEIEMTCDPGTSYNETLQICDEAGCGKTCSNSGQCAGKPDGTLIADPNSTGYIKCECECEIEMTCDPGTSFDESLQICDQTGCSKTCSNSGQCAGKPDGTLIADPNTTGYIKCECECEIEMTCDPGTSYNETLQICDQTGCGKTCSNSGQCAGKPDGTLIADPNSTGYIKCECECEIEMTCDPGTSYNETLQICDQTGCGKTCSNSGQCAGKPDGTLIADPNSTGYIKCECECEIEMTCDAGTAFDETLQSCEVIPCTGSDCEGGPSTGPSGTTCSNSGECVGKLDGTLLTDPNSTGYIVCQCECEIAMPCAPGTAFNETLQTCTHVGCGRSGGCGSG